MQIKAIPGPIEALLSPFGTAGFFVADDAEVASCTHNADFVKAGVAGAPAASVWVAVPFGREVLVAAAMADNGGSIDAYDLAVITDDQVRSWALGTLMYVGAGAAATEIDTTRFQRGYPEAAETAAFFRLVCNRIDAAFSFPTSAADAASAHSPEHALTTR
jgi:hypothetical protein